MSILSAPADVRHLLRVMFILSAPYRIGSYRELFAAALWPPGGFAAPYGLGSTLSLERVRVVRLRPLFRRLNTAFDDIEISILPLSGFYRSKIDRLSGLTQNMNGPLWLIGQLAMERAARL